MFWRPLASATGPRFVGCTALCAVQWRGLPHTQRGNRRAVGTHAFCPRARTSQPLSGHSPHSHRRCWPCTPSLSLPSGSSLLLCPEVRHPFFAAVSTAPLCACPAAVMAPREEQAALPEGAAAEQAPVSAAPASGSPAARDASHTGFALWPAASSVVCVPCQTTLTRARAFARHICTSKHKVAATAMTALVSSLNEAGKALPTHVAAAVATPEACKDLLAPPPSASVLLVRSAYAADTVWPTAPDARHPDAVVGLDTQFVYACYSCRSAAPTVKAVHKPVGGAGAGVCGDGGGGDGGGDEEAEGPPASVVTSCSNTVFHRVSAQTLLRGNKTAFFPVAFSRLPGSALPIVGAGNGAGADHTTGHVAEPAGGGGGGGTATAGGGAGEGAAPSTPAPPSAALSVDVFLGMSARSVSLGGRRRNSAWSTLPTAELESSPATCGGLLHMYDWLGHLQAANWTPSSVLDRFGVYDNPTDATPSEPCGWLFFLSLRAAVSKMFDSALGHLRKCDPTVLGKLAIGSLPTTPTAGTVAKAEQVGHYPAFNIRVQPRTVERYEHDAALALYAAVVVGVDARRSEAVALEEGTVVPDLSAAVSTAVELICASYPPPEGGPPAPSPPSGSCPRAAVETAAKEIGEGRLLEPTAVALVALCHERFDPRSVANGGSGKLQSDVSLLLPFLSVLYAHYSSRSPATLTAAAATAGGGGGGGGGASAAARASGVSIVDATGAQHLAASLLFAVRIANTVHFMHQQHATVEELFSQIAYLSDPSETTAASSVVLLYARSARMAAAEAKAPVYLPCHEPSHVRGIPPSLGTGHCGALLGRGVHISTVAVGQRVAALQEEMFRRTTDLLFGYDPVSSGVLGPDALLLVDRVSNADPGVSLLQISENEQVVRGWVSHFLSSGALDGNAVPVRPSYKAADGGGEGAREVDPVQPPIICDSAAFEAHRVGCDELRALFWALIYIVSGAPSRQTESAETTLCASAARPLRSLHIHEGLFFTILVYNKNQSVSEGVGRPISRWLDAKSSSLLLMYLVFVEPLDAYFARAVAGRGDGVTMSMARAGGPATTPPSVIDRSLLFRDRAGKALPVSRLNWALQDKLLGGISSVPVGVQLWRQWAAGAAKQITKMDVLDASFGALSGRGGGGVGGAVSSPAFSGLPSIGNAVVGTNIGGILEQQSGHSAMTAAASYAGDPTLSINRVNTASVFLFRSASACCQAAMGLRSAHPGGSAGMRHPLEPNPTTAAAAAPEPSPLPPYRQQTNNNCSGSGGGVTVTPRRPPVAPASQVVALQPQLQLARKYRVGRLAAEALADVELRRLYGAKATYKTEQQQQAVYAVLHARDPQTVLTVLPTGGGKTNVWLLPCAVERRAAEAAAWASALTGLGGARSGGTPAAPAAAAQSPAPGAGGGAPCGAAAVASPSGGSASPLSWGPPVTVVLTPTVAVSATAREAAEAAGVVAIMWPTSASGRSASLYPTDASVLIVDMCTVVVDRVGFLQFLSALDAVGRLARLVIDEVHLVSLWAGFRHHLLQLRDVLADLRCPSVLLSATVPPTAVTELSLWVGHTPSRPFTCIRQSVRRENVAYWVERCPFVFSRRPRNTVAAGGEDPNSALHRAVAQRAVRQVHQLRSASGTIAGRSACVAVCCETTAEVDGIAASIGALLELHVSAGLAAAAFTDAAEASGSGGGEEDGLASAAQASMDVVVLKFHSQLDAAELAAPAPPPLGMPRAGGGRGSSGTSRSAVTGGSDSLFAQCARVYAKGQLLRQGPGPDAARGGGSQRRAGSGVASSPVRSSRPSASAAAVVAAEAAADGVGVVVMVGSPAVTTGSDFSNMVWGFFLGGRNLVTFAQASGRLSRDAGSMATAVVWNPQRYSEVLVDPDGAAVVDVDGLGDFDAWADGSLSSPSGSANGLAQVCRRWGLDSVLDGVPEADFKTCLDAGSAQCDLCSSRAATAAAGRRPGVLAMAAQSKEAAAAVPGATIAPLGRPLGTLVGRGTPARGQQQQRRRARAGGADVSVDGTSSGLEEQPVQRRCVSRRLFGTGDATGGVLGRQTAVGTSVIGAPSSANVRSSPAAVGIGLGGRSGWSLSRSGAGTRAASFGSAAGSPVSPALSTLPLQGLDLLVACGSDDDGGSQSAAAPASDRAAGRLTVALLPDERALVFTQQMVDVMRTGGRAALALRQKHRDDRPVPCAWCCARGAQLPSGAHSTATCFLGTCCSCLKQTNGWPGGPELEALSPHTERCDIGWHECKSRRQAWDTGAEGNRCMGCTLHNMYKPERTATAIASHDVVRFGPKSCSWLFCIRVALVQMQLARRRMSQRQPAFAPALLDACGVAWKTRSVSDGVAGRVPPPVLLDWGSMQAPASANKVAEWLTSATQGVPNLALFAPVLADALGVSF